MRATRTRTRKKLLVSLYSPAVLALPDNIEHRLASNWLLETA